jgi:chromosomal replication initiation ATPase DnaA
MGETPGFFVIIALEPSPMLHAIVRPHPISPALPSPALHLVGNDGTAPPLPRDAIEQAVVLVFGVGRDDLRRLSRGRAQVALARQVAMYLAHVACGLTLTDTGRLFDRDRTTVAHACGVIEDRRDDPLFDRALDLLEWSVPALATRPSIRHLTL